MQGELFEDLVQLYERGLTSELAVLLKLKEEKHLPSFDTAQVRFLKRARLLAEFLVDDEGVFHKKKLLDLKRLFDKEGHLLYPCGFNDSFYLKQIHSALNAFVKEEALFKKVSRLSPPLCHPLAEGIVLCSLGLEGKHKMTAALIKRAVLSACFVPLRQNVGSCFATAPAILVQKENLQQMLEDFSEILFTGKLKRVFGGVEYAVPLAPSSGSGIFFENLSPLHEEALRKVLKMLDIESVDIRLPTQVGTLLRELLLKKLGLYEEEIVSFKAGKVVRDPSKKEEKILSFKELEKKAKMLFCSVFDHSLLKAWEFTIASFSEAKMEFSNWNLYTSLGLHAEEKGGIGEVIVHFLEENLRELKTESEKWRQEYENAIGRARAVESIMRGIFDDKERARYNAELQANIHHARTLSDMQNEAYSKASHFSALFPKLLKQYTFFFPLYFQEIYDADMVSSEEAFYGDSPAGFRLVYKHGRRDPYLWTLIYEEEEYIQSLIDFFVLTEQQIFSNLEWEGGEKAFTDLNTAIISHLRTPLFLETALQRIKKAYPSQEEVRKPWVYISGGTLETLMHTYFKKEGKLVLEQRGVETPSDLGIFVVETLKNNPLPQGSFLMSSPGHAFLLDPSFPLFAEGWQDSGFTYTWVRDQIFLPALHFYEQMKLSSAAQDFLWTRWSTFPHLVFPSSQEMDVRSFRQTALSLLPTSFSEERFAILLDSFLYESLPLIPESEVSLWLERLLSPFGISGFLPFKSQEFFTALEIKEMAKMLYVSSQGMAALNFDLDLEIEKRARLISIAPPAPLLFGDSNWATYFFACTVNPGTGNLELWRLNALGSRGAPMTEWKHAFHSGERVSWTIYRRIY